jgi:Tol biopolymer transport system component
METGDQLSLLQEGEGAFEPAVSPDGQWLAYLGGKVQRGESFWLLVVSAGGQEQAAIPPGEEWEYLSGWLDNQRLILSGLLVPGDAYTPVVPSLVLNPFTGERQELPPAPLDLYTLYPYPNWLGRGMISYDPALRYRVYPNQNYDLVFEDLQTHEILTQFLVPIWDAVPRWSPDGQQFVITKAENYTPGPVDYELYNVSIDGQVTQLTKLTTYYNETYIPYYDWSPDGNHLAFWLETDPEDENSIDLVVLDTVTFDVVNYCVTSHYRGNTTPPLFWSPDSRQLVMEIDDANDSTLKRVVVVDIVDGWAAQIAEDMEPVGWMVSP